MGGLRCRIAVMVHQCRDLIDQPTPTNRDAWNVLKQDEFRQIVLIRLKRKKETASNKAIERLVLEQDNNNGNKVSSKFKILNEG